MGLRCPSFPLLVALDLNVGSIIVYLDTWDMNKTPPSSLSLLSPALATSHLAGLGGINLTLTSFKNDIMKQIMKIMSLVVAITAFWIGLLKTSLVPDSYTWMDAIYGLLMVGIGLMLFRTCPEEAIFLQKDITEARVFLKEKGVDVGPNQ